MSEGDVGGPDLPLGGLALELRQVLLVRPRPVGAHLLDALSTRRQTLSVRRASARAHVSGEDHYDIPDRDFAGDAIQRASTLTLG